jgi:hypothetical protein
LLREFQTHCLLSLDAVRLLECGEVEPLHSLGAVLDDLAAVVDEAVDAERLRPIKMRLELKTSG